MVDDDTPMPANSPAQVTVYELLAASMEYTPAEPRLSLDAWCELPDGLIMWSSGSTGQPKGVVKTVAKFLKNLERNAQQVGHRPDDVLLPFSHQYGLSMVLIAWLVKCSLVIAPYRRLDRAMIMAGTCGASVVDATPASYRSMLNMIGRKPALADTLSGVRMFCSGAAPLDPGLVADYVSRFGLPLLDSYGSTEAGNVAFATEDNAVACGRAVQGLELRIVDDEGAVLASGEVGEIQVHSPDLMGGLPGGGRHGHPRRPRQDRLVPHRRLRLPGRRGQPLRPRPEVRGAPQRPHALPRHHRAQAGRGRLPGEGRPDPR